MPPTRWNDIEFKSILNRRRHFSKVRSVSHSPAERAKRHREEAAKLRSQAAEMPWADLSIQLERIAREYEMLAEAIERRLPSPPNHSS
jgi:hypothetical protein